MRSRDCLYLWNESCALELSNGSNGWFRFILDGKLATMYSSGSPEGGSDSSGRYSILIFFILGKQKILITQCFCFHVKLNFVDTVLCFTDVNKLKLFFTNASMILTLAVDTCGFFGPKKLYLATLLTNTYTCMRQMLNSVHLVSFTYRACITVYCPKG